MITILRPRETTARQTGNDILRPRAAGSHDNTNKSLPFPKGPALLFLRLLVDHLPKVDLPQPPTVNLALSSVCSSLLKFKGMRQRVSLLLSEHYYYVSLASNCYDSIINDSTCTC